MISRRYSACFLGIFMTASCALAHAIPAVSFSDYSTSGTANPSVRGWMFDVQAANGIDVYALGVFDHLQDGLSQSHEVGLWRSDGTLLSSVNIEAGTVSPLDENGLFRIAAVNPVHLEKGTGYVVAAVYSPFPLDDFQAVYANNAAFDSSIKYQAPMYLSESLPVLAFPNSSVSIGPGIFGASFEFQPSPIPEPSKTALIALGFAAAIVLRGHGKKQL